MDVKKIFSSQIGVVMLQFASLLLVFTLSRILFYFINIHYFANAEWIHFLWGIRFDISILLYINAIYFIFLLIPYKFTNTRVAHIIGDIYFIVVNSFALLLNLIDTAYYPFSMRRMTGDIFQFVGVTNNMSSLIPTFLREYFYLLLILILFIILLFFITKITRREVFTDFPTEKKGWIKTIALRLILLGCMLVGMRGGLQYRPINNAVAVAAGGVENSALILNSPFSLLTNLHQSSLTLKNYFQDENECEKYFTTSKKEFENQYFTAPPTQNIVLIFLEGISSEYSSFLADDPKNNAGYTPFLDSLAQHSIVFKGFANGQQSIEALSSILGGIPSLMSTPFSQSAYTTNQIQYAIPKIKEKGIITAFFHGGKNGTMGFDRFCQMVGIDHYYGMNEYPNASKDFDGTWGIPDVPYLQYVASELNQFQKPFFATIFTLSSHHPFIVPEAYDKQVTKGDFPMQHSVAYTDRALKEFFEKVSKEEWYQKTLFIITADHTNFSGATAVDYQKHRYSIPIIFYHPKNDTSFVSPQIMQQTDIMPTLFSFCQWNDSFSSFGNNALDSTLYHFTINYLSNSYLLFIDQYLIEFDGKNIQYIWDLSANANERRKEKKDCPRIDEYEKLLQSIIQQFNNKLIYNKL